MLRPRLDGHVTLATRRLFLKGFAGAVATAVAIPGRVLAGPREERLASFVHTHTHERLTVPYFADGAYLPEGLASLNSFLRDHRTGEEHAIDPALYDILNDLRLATGAKSPFQVISAYRSSRTNAMLREHGGGVAKGSLHLSGPRHRRPSRRRLFRDVARRGDRAAARRRRLLPRPGLRARGHRPHPPLVALVRRTGRRVAACLALLLAAGCATVSNYEDPAAPVYAGGIPRAGARARRCAS